MIKNVLFSSCSKLVISVTEHLVEVVDKLSGKKTTEVVESLSTTSTRCSVTEITSLLQDLINRMRNLHQIVLFSVSCCCISSKHENMVFQREVYVTVIKMINLLKLCQNDLF